MDDSEKTDRLDQFAEMVLGSGLRPPGSTEFLRQIEAKLDFGTRKYGPGSWKRHDMLAELLTELVDLYNYPYLIWRVLLELGVDKSHPQVFLRAQGTLRRIALEAYNNWATLSRLGETLDALEVPRSVSGEDRLGVQMEAMNDAVPEGPGDAGLTDDESPDGSPDDRGSGGGDSSSEVPAAPADATPRVRSGHQAPRVRRRSSAS